jgi:hypothetical protein
MGWYAFPVTPLHGIACFSAAVLDEAPRIVSRFDAEEIAIKQAHAEGKKRVLSPPLT